MKKAIYILLLFLMASCQREPFEETISREPIVKPSTDLVIGNIEGQITGEDGLGLANVTVQSADRIKTTDAEGKFFFENAEIYKDGSLITAEKEGFFAGSRRFYAQANQINQIKIQLIPKLSLKTFDASDGTTADFGMASINFPSGVYLKSDSTPYNGNIEIFGKWLDPTLQSTFSQMPGDLTGYDKDNKLRVLASFGLLYVELRGDNNDSLMLPEGLQAEIAIEIPEELQQYAPSTIPMLFYNPELNSWIENKTAEKNGPTYIGTVDQIGFWNCSLSLPLIDVQGKIKINDEPTSLKEFQLSAPSFGYSAFATTSELGNFTGRLPMGIELKITVLDECGNFPVIENIPPIQNEEEFLALNIELYNTNSLRVEGDINSCNNISSDLLYAMVSLESTKYLVKADENGLFDTGQLPVNSCNTSEVTVYGLDLENGFSTPPLSHDVVSSISLPSIMPCESIPSGFEIDYINMEWKNELATTVTHRWTVSRISSTPAKLIFNPVMTGINGEEFMSGAILVTEGSNVASYLLEYETQGFEVSGNCTIDTHQHDGYTSYRFVDTTTDIEITDPSLFPGMDASAIGSVHMNLVYYN